MKIKKFNAAAAGLAVTIIAGSLWLFGPNLFSSNTGSENAVVSKVLAGELEYSTKDKKIIQIEWKGEKGNVPGKTTLVKWFEGDRVYYQMSGPVNKASLKETDFFDGKSKWGESTEMEVYFQRTGNAYDQWLLNSENSQILHFSNKNKFASSSDVPASRYTCELKGDQLVTTFWCPKTDTPQNIVFNYHEKNSEIGNKGLSWLTTGDPVTPWDHHDSSRWNQP